MTRFFYCTAVCQIKFMLLQVISQRDKVPKKHFTMRTPLSFMKWGFITGCWTLLSQKNMNSISSGTADESVNGHFLVKSVSKLYLQVDLICQNIHLVSYRRVPGSIPGRGSIDYFSFFPHFSYFFDRFPFCSTRISKIGKCAAFQLWTPKYHSVS